MESHSLKLVYRYLALLYEFMVVIANNGCSLFTYGV